MSDNDNYTKLIDLVGKTCDNVDEVGLIPNVMMYAMLNLLGWREGQEITDVMLETISRALTYAQMDWDC